jgi:hypothetical protein
MSQREEYLGDGCYCSWDGFAFTLRAPRGPIDHFVVLEPEVLREFENFVKRTEQEIEEQRQGREQCQESQHEEERHDAKST